MGEEMTQIFNLFQSYLSNEQELREASTKYQLLSKCLFLSYTNSQIEQHNEKHDDTILIGF